MIKIAVFASGTGSNFVNLMKHPVVQKHVMIDLLVCDNPNAKVIDEAKKLGVTTLVFNPKEYMSKKEYEDIVLDRVKAYDLLVLAGYMRIISRYFLEHYHGQIINIHPSLLPLYKGVNAIERAYNNQEKTIGVTVHYVNEEVDDGEIILQDCIQVDYTQSLEIITQKVHQLEHQLYPKALLNILKIDTLS